MGLAQYLLILILFGVPEYVRDVTAAPFYGSRILFIDLYMGATALLLCALLANRSQATVAVGSGATTRVNRVFHGMLVLCLALFALAFFHEGGSFFAPLQATVFCLALAVLTLILMQGQHFALLDRMGRFLTVLVIWECLVAGIGYFVPLSLELGAPRNLWPYIAVLLLALNRHYGRPGVWLLFFNSIALIVINSTKAAIILLAIVLLAGWTRRLWASRPALSYTLAAMFIALIAGAYVFIYQLGMNALLIGSLAEFEAMGHMNRAGIDNQAGSLISRIFSVPYTLNFVVEQNAYLGMGGEKAAAITFWGYPVHNLFVSYIAVFGLTGLLFFLLYMLMSFRISKVSLSVFTIAVFVPMVANDLYPVIALCLLPLLTISAHEARHNIRTAVGSAATR